MKKLDIKGGFYVNCYTKEEVLANINLFKEKGFKRFRRRLYTDFKKICTEDEELNIAFKKFITIFDFYFTRGYEVSIDVWEDCSKVYVSNSIEGLDFNDEFNDNVVWPVKESKTPHIHNVYTGISYSEWEDLAKTQKHLFETKKFGL
jgi:hypothetical protein